MKTILLLLLILGTTYATTHVNISIAQQSVRRHSDDDTAEGNSNSIRQSTDLNNRDNAEVIQLGRLQKQRDHNSHHNVYSYNQMERLTDRTNDYQRPFSSEMQQKQNQYRTPSEQYVQNQEFERYIENYHSGPTVETIYESATPASQRDYQGSTSSASSAPFVVDFKKNSMQMFERQVALPNDGSAGTTNVESNHQKNTAVHHPHTYMVEEPDQGSPIATSNTVVGTATSAPELNYDINKNAGSGINYDHINSNPNGKPYFHQSNLKPEVPPPVDLQNHYIGSHNEPHMGYFGNNDQPEYYNPADVSEISGNGYLPPQPNYHRRPIVTKTIQIAQPALRAKKFEVRHPAIQKEFYDIEERVLIKPAGTIVVELERPVAKIPKGETILPLGHPHPAVAAAYHRNSNDYVETQSSSKSSSSSSGNVGAHPAIGVTTLGSSVTATPTNDQNSRNKFLEGNLRRQFKDDSSLITPPEHLYTKESNSQSNINNENLYMATVSNGNQRQNQPTGKTYYDDAEIRFHKQDGNENNNGQDRSFTSTVNNQNNYNHNLNIGNKPINHPYHQANYNDNSQYESNYRSGEYYNNHLNNQQEQKSARLRELPQNNIYNRQQNYNMNNDHQIQPAPYQPNIYQSRIEMDRNPNSFNSQRNYVNYEQIENKGRDHPLPVMGVKPYLFHHNGPTILYSPMNRTSYENDKRKGVLLVPIDWKSDQEQKRDNENRNKKVQYSGSYSNMRYVPRESAPLTFKEKDNENDVHKAVINFVQTPADGQGHSHLQIKIPTQTKIEHQMMHDEDDKENQKHSETTDLNHVALSVDCNHKHNSDVPQKAGYEQNPAHRQMFMRIVDAQSANFDNNDRGEVENSSTVSSTPRTIIPAENVDLNLKSSAGNIATPGQRVIAATPAPSDASSSSESFHKRRIVVNHPFQTVREVVEHEPITNYHQIQVNEPAPPLHYTSPIYSRRESALRQMHTPELAIHH